MTLSRQAQGLHRLIRIGKWIARSGYAQYGDFGPLDEHLVEVIHGLPRLQNGTRDAGPAFIRAVEFAIAEIALDIATRRDGKMNASEFVLGIAAEARVLGEVDGDCFRSDGIGGGVLWAAPFVARWRGLLVGIKVIGSCTRLRISPVCIPSGC